MARPGKQPRRQTDSVATQVRQRVERGGEGFWTFKDFDDLPTSAVAMALSRLTREGVLRRERKGVYYRPRPTPFGLSIASASGSAALSLANRSVAPAGLTAANALGFTTQNPARQEFATPAPAPPSALTDARVRTRRPQSRHGLPPEDGALLEFLRERAATSDLPAEETYERLFKLLGDPERFRRVAEVALDEPPRVRAILGAIGQQIGVPEPRLAELRASLNPLSRFDFGLLRGLQHAQTWQAK